jgi:hypothetical protein
VTKKVSITMLMVFFVVFVIAQVPTSANASQTYDHAFRFAQAQNRMKAPCRSVFML